MNGCICPEGKRVLECNNTQNTQCMDCPIDTFSDKKNEKKECQRCQICRRKEVIKRKCTKTSNTICKCRLPGYIYLPPKPCFKCPQGLIVKNNRCSNVTSKIVDGPAAAAISTKSSTLIIGMSVAIFLVILLIIIAFFIIYKRRSRRGPLQDGGNTPDVLKNITKTPPLPPKMTRRRNENAYGPAPNCRLLGKEQKLVSRQLPFSLMHDMNIMLDVNHSKNYKHLAGKLGYNYDFVKLLGTKSQPLETLMDDFMSQENPTKEQLYEALVQIDRHDVAKMVYEEL